MKKRLGWGLTTLLIVVGLVIAGYIGGRRWFRSVPPCGGGDFTILCMGDSITAEGYPAVLGGILKRHGYKNICVRNYGRKGDTSGEYLDFLRSHPGVLNGQVDMVLLELGTNDVRIDHDHTETRTFAANVAKIVGLIREKHPRARIFIATLPPILRDIPGYFDWTSRKRVTTEINPYIRALAHRLRCTRVDVYPAFASHPEWIGRDGIHPTRQGVRELAGIYFRAIQPVLSRVFGVIRVTLPPGFHEKVVFQSDADGDTDLYLLTPKGLRKLTRNSYPDEYPVFSPDGTRILYTTKPGKHWKLALYFLHKGKSVVILDLNPFNIYVPDWCPDGHHVVFATDKWGKSELAMYDLQTRKLTRLTDTFGRNTLPNCSPDGRSVVFTGNRGLGWHIYRLDLKTRTVTKLTNRRGNCRPHYSPDGEWIAFVSEHFGKSDIFLMRPDGTKIHPLTNDPEHWEYYPAWSRDGKRVYFSESVRHRGAPWHLWVIHSDGTHPFQITDGFSKDRFANAF